MTRSSLVASVAVVVTGSVAAVTALAVACAPCVAPAAGEASSG